MSTSLLVENMKKAAVKRGLEVYIEAIAAEEFDSRLETFDVVLLGPQVRYKRGVWLPKAQAAAKPLDVIEPVTYGTVNGDKALDQALSLLR
jgi:cellobiose PTS system EIIB component